eukprot:s1574_g10.t1
MGLADGTVECHLAVDPLALAAPPRIQALDAVKAWGEEASKAAAAARAAQRRAVPQKQGEGKAQATAPKDKGLVIRIFGRWPAPEDWVNIANLPLAGDWREQALRLLLPSAKDVQDAVVVHQQRGLSF